MKYPLLMPLGCALAVLLIFLLPTFGLSNGWSLALGIIAMLGCHFMHLGHHKQPQDKPKSGCH